MPSTIGIVASGVFPFTPADLSPAAWYDASDASTITASSGAVSQWSDKSSNSRHLTQATGASQPTTGTRTLNGLNVIDFDGVNDYLSAGDTLDIGSGGLTAVGIAKLDTASIPSTRGLWGKSRAAGQAGRWTFLWDSASGGFFGLFEPTTGINRTVVNDPGVSGRTNNYVWAMRIIRSTPMTLRRNNAVVATDSGVQSSTNLNTTNPFMVGAYQNSTGTGPLAGSYLDGYIAELVICLRDLTDSEMDSLATYLNAKWAVY